MEKLSKKFTLYSPFNFPNYEILHGCGTLITIDEPIIIYYYQLKSVVFIEICSFCCAFYGF